MSSIVFLSRIQVFRCRVFKPPNEASLSCAGTKKNEKSVQDLDCQNANAGANAENPASGCLNSKLLEIKPVQAESSGF